MASGMEIPATWAPESDDTIRDAMKLQKKLGFQKCAIRNNDNTYNAALIVMYPVSGMVMFFIARASKFETADAALDYAFNAMKTGSFAAWRSCYELIPGTIPAG